MNAAIFWNFSVNFKGGFYYDSFFAMLATERCGLHPWEISDLIILRQSAGEQLT